MTKKEFEHIQGLILGFDFPWYFNKTIDYAGQVRDYFQFTHLFYNKGLISSNYFKDLRPIINRLKVFNLSRVKSNLLTRTETRAVNQFHIDESTLSVKKLEHWTTAIFYINTNNGYTEFEDGTKVESVANRIVTFPANTKHRGTSCTDEKTRIVINFNSVSYTHLTLPTTPYV